MLWSNDSGAGRSDAKPADAQTLAAAPDAGSMDSTAGALRRRIDAHQGFPASGQTDPNFLIDVAVAHAGRGKMPAMELTSPHARRRRRDARCRPRRAAPANLPVAAWLFVCCALVFAMVVVGGVTRLTHSGLSIIEWQPIVGTLPPLTDAQWQEAFDKYQLTPEYRQVNQGMALAEFKGIFWWEYFHRLLGRAIGVVFLLPLALVRACAAGIPRGHALEARRHLRAGRAAGRDGLVHGARAASSTTRACRSSG